MVETMRELVQKTRRIRRGWLDRLRGYDRLYETELTDGQHTAYEGDQPPTLRRNRHSVIGKPNLVRSPKANLLCAALPQSHLQ